MSENSRREFLRKSAYAAPAIISLAAMPAIAKTGSPDVPNEIREKCNNGIGNGIDCQPPGNPRPNDQPIAVPGNPQTQNNK
jgi:hypothetical protein